MGILSSKTHMFKNPWHDYRCCDSSARSSTEQHRLAFDSFTDEEAVAFLERFDFTQGAFVSQSGIRRPLWRASVDTVIKRLGSHKTSSWIAYEAHTMVLVASQTTIPVPRIRKQVVWKDTLYVFMEYVEGEDLTNVWPSLWWWSKFRIAWNLRSYVSQLRKVVVPQVPGPIDGSGEPLSCTGHFFTGSGDGPFPSYAKLSAWYASKRRITIALEKERCALQNKPYTAPDIHFDDSAPLVLTHGDISLNNVRLGKDGTVWLLDWGRSGVYPQWFEYSAIMTYDDFLKRLPRSWFWFAPLIAGRYQSQDYFMKRISLALLYYGLEDPEPDPSDP